MLKITKILLTLFLINVALPKIGLAEKAPLSYESFDGSVIGARAIGMGEAFVGLSNDGNGAYWNPAGLTQLPRNLFTTCFNLRYKSDENLDTVLLQDPLRGGKLTYLSFASKTGALSYRPLSKITTNTYKQEQNTQTWTTLDTSVNELMLSIAKPYKESIYIGMNFNYLWGSLGWSKRTVQQTTEVAEANVDSANGWSIDLGMLFKASTFLNFGVSVQNAWGGLYWKDYDRTSLPVVWRTGMAITLPHLINFVYDYEKRSYPDSPDVSFKHIGLEQNIYDTVFIRLGMSGKDWNDPKEVIYTLGVGYTRDFYGVDLAMKKSTVMPEVKGVYTYIGSLTLPF